MASRDFTESFFKFLRENHLCDLYFLRNRSESWKNYDRRIFDTFIVFQTYVNFKIVYSFEEILDTLITKKIVFNPIHLDVLCCLYQSLSSKTFNEIKKDKYKSACKILLLYLVESLDKEKLEFYSKFYQKINFTTNFIKGTERIQIRDLIENHI